MKKRVLSTRATAETGLTKISATVTAANGNDGKTRKKSRQAVEESITDETSAGDFVSNPWYTFFTKDDVEYNEYMATEWGFERRGDAALFEKISLEGAQSGLSWLTVLRKRPAYRKAFYNFDPAKVALMTENNIRKLIDFQSENPRDQLVRHREKIESVINNAKCIVQLREELSTKETSFGVFDDLLWSFVDHKPILNRCSLSQLPSKSPESEAMSKALKKRGFKFVGPTTCYSMMQAIGMVIDHPMDSPEWLAAHERLKQRPGGFQERSP
ncbi:DNA-3-methyladenine glycosylase I [Fistulifera solaris]|uniref:DNA-3-methyladenine glycosylase I n=1 Tax=Fistulifera solaris TaxID=1519565 RepID=A0A1Z5J827_FISSO|nr:DNA-3-methyladenine glycosylase I [Fistulifera solaris]|eukprot:GAX09931.1 DNA-3-methyladenine glycosylase I [Fistulifera solaris]